MAAEDEIFEYVPPSAAAPEDAAPPPPTEGLDTSALATGDEAFRAAAAGLTRDAAGRALHGGRAPQRSAFEHPRLKLARLRREADELAADLAAAPEAYDGRTAATLLHDVEDLRLALQRLAKGLPAEPPAPPAESAAAAAAAARRAAHAVQGALERARLREDGDPVGRDFAARGLEHGLELLLGELVVAIALVEQQRGHGDHDLLLVAAGEFSEGRRHLNCVFTFKLKKALNHVCAGISGTYEVTASVHAYGTRGPQNSHWWFLCVCGAYAVRRALVFCVRVVVEAVSV